MNVIKLNLSKKLIDVYTNFPPSLKDQTIAKLVIHLCQDIIFDPEQLRLLNDCTKRTGKVWYTRIENRLTGIYESLPLPTALKNLVIIRCRPAAIHLFIWIMQQGMFNISPIFAYNLLTSSDWTVEMKLDEKKIAERLVQDDRIPVHDRYRMACFHSLESFIHSLWNQFSLESSKVFFGPDQCILVRLWSYQLVVGLEEFTRTGSFLKSLFVNGEDFIRSNTFWDILLHHGVSEGSTSTVIQCCGELQTNIRQEIFIDMAIRAVLQIHARSNGEYFYKSYQMSPTPYRDILCFLLTQMSKEQRVAFFHKALRLSRCNVLVFFLKWPYMDLMIPIIKEIWDVLPEEKYEDLLMTIAYSYSNKTDNIRINDYIDIDYGSLMIELLEESPDKFKRYIFGDVYQTDPNIFYVGKLLFTVINQHPLKIRDINLFQRMWQYVTLEEKRIFLKSKYGEIFCCHLVLEEHWELLNSTLRESLLENDLTEFKKKILRSESGKYLCLNC